MEFGLDTFGDITADLDGTMLGADHVIRNIVNEAVLADELGVDVFGIGEHHREDFAVSAPEVVLAGIATRTERIKLQPAVVVLGSDDPKQVVERYTTVHALSNGRAELNVGRGSFTESFPLFGYDFADYEELFEEKLARLREILDGRGSEAYPSIRSPLPAWVAVGGTPKSALRAAQHNMDLAIAVISGNPMYFKTFAELYHQANEQLGHPRGRVAVHSPGLIAPTDAEARERLLEPWMTSQKQIGADRGWPAPSIGRFNIELGHGSLYAGSPETVARKIVKVARQLNLDRFVLKYSNGPIPHEYAMETIRLYGEEVIPLVRDMLDQE